MNTHLSRHWLNQIFALLCAGLSAVSAQSGEESITSTLYLRSAGGSLVLVTNAPPATTWRTKSSAPVGRGTFVEIGTWRAAPAAGSFDLIGAGTFHGWMGRRITKFNGASENSENSGTFFDIRVELLRNGEPVQAVAGQTLNLRGVKADPAKPTPVIISLNDPPGKIRFNPGDVLGLRLLARVSAKGGHPTAPGASVFFDATLRPSQIDITYAVVPLTLSVESGSDAITVAQGNSQNVVTVLTVTNTTGAARQVINQVTITPNNGGLLISSDYPAGGYLAANTRSFVLNQSFRGVVPGAYVVSNHASIVGAGVEAQDVILVTVLPPGGDPIIQPVGAVPSGVLKDVPTEVTFTASIANFFTPAAQLSLRFFNGADNPVVTTLHDDGISGDLQAGDGVYSGRLLIYETNTGLLQFFASGFFPGVPQEKASGVGNLMLTIFPTVLRPVDPARAVVNPATGESFACDEVLMYLDETNNCDRCAQLAALVNGIIVGSDPGLGLFQIAIPNPGCSVQPVLNAVNTLSVQPDVLAAEPNLLGTGTTEFTPNDPDYSSQYAPQKIRADEAWVIARGGPVIAVVDTGVNYNHEDLSAKVIKGYDYIGGDNDPQDEGDHGTHVAGIAGAASHNSKGIAGIAIDSKILAIRGIGGSYAALGSAIKYAADNGAKVINISGGGTSDVLAVKNAVTYAVGKGCLVVSTPANLGQVASGGNYYPGAYPNVFCVGSTTSTDALAADSNPAAYVDITAPGQNIRSCLSAGGYGLKSGVSMAAPCVAGAAAVVWGRFPAWTAGQVRQRLEKTAVPMTGSGVGAGRIDLFEAVFNGSFEDDMNGWTTSGTSGAVPSLGPLVPRDRKKMGFASSGPDASQISTSLEQAFTIQSDVTSFKLSFDYNFVTEEYPEFVGTQYNDNLRISLITPSGSTVQLAYEDVNTSAFTLVGGIDFPGGDSTVGQTGWKTVSMAVPVAAGPGTYRIVVRDEGDGIYDSNVLIDKIRFK